MAKYNAIGALVTDLTTIRSTLASVNSGAKDDGTLRIVMATDQPTMANAQPVSGTVTATGPLTDAQLRATPVPVSGTVTATTGGLTDAQLRASAVPVSGTFFQATQPVSGTFFQVTQPVSGTFFQATQPVSGPLTDTQLRATAVPVSGTVTASGPLTDTQLRATPVPVSGTVTANTGGLTDTQLRASAVPVSGTVTATPSALPAAPKYGRATVAVTNTAVQLASNALVNGVIVQALKGNSANTFVIGDASVTTSNGFELQPGQATSAGVANTNTLYINGTAGDACCFIGS